jgi:hypothetical protein
MALVPRRALAGLAPCGDRLQQALAVVERDAKLHEVGVEGATSRKANPEASGALSNGGRYRGLAIGAQSNVAPLWQYATSAEIRNLTANLPLPAGLRECHRCDRLLTVATIGVATVSNVRRGI